MIYISNSYNLKWRIKGIDGYAFAENKKLYNLKRNTEVKKILIGYTVGYWLHGKFYSLKKLTPLIEKYEEEYCPL